MKKNRTQTEATFESSASAPDVPMDEIPGSDIEITPLDESTPSLEERCQAAEEEARQNYDRLLRVSAEFDNYKKRTQRDMEDFRKYANEAILSELLTVIDNLERAIQSGKDSEGSINCLTEGVDLTMKELLKIFERFSVRQIDAVGRPFDPNFHQAVLQETSNEHPTNTVLQEFQKGYLLHDRLLRPAMVVVSKAE
jgi:molecular chaperone GrpE